MHALFLAAIYIAVALAPVALAWAQGLPPRPFLDELSSAVALVAFAVLLMEFVLSGRFPLVSGRIGIDNTMRFHQLIARPVTVLVLLHPFFYTLPMGGPLPWDPSGAETLSLDAGNIIAGLVAWIVLAALVLMAVFRDKLGFRYEAWRVSHGIGATLLAGFGAFHAIDAGRYSAHPWLFWFWMALLALAALTLLIVYLFRPLIQLRHPYTVRRVQQAAERTWELALAPARGEALRFNAGQFVWLTVDRSAFAVREHPFSIASAPADRPEVSFVIKEVGDFTRQIGEIREGARAYLDGPHGHLVLPEGDGEGIVFLAGGVGIVPILSQLRQLRADGDRRPMKLLYGNRRQEQIVYPEELRAMSRDLNLEVVHVLAEPPADWDGETGALDAETVARHCPPQDRRAHWYFVVCGPPAMIDGVRATLAGLGVPAGRILSEKFSYD
ncbi:MAG: ferredoxin reductase family protein [Rhodovibrionaceae bacterium]|nr:ferredoxin reductase family protein [Rhodovibrionaceae bacterium]